MSKKPEFIEFGDTQIRLSCIKNFGIATKHISSSLNDHYGLLNKILPDWKRYYDNFGLKILKAPTYWQKVLEVDKLAEKKKPFLKRLIPTEYKHVDKFKLINEKTAAQIKAGNGHKLKYSSDIYCGVLNKAAEKDDLLIKEEICLVVYLLDENTHIVKHDEGPATYTYTLKYRFCFLYPDGEMFLSSHQTDSRESEIQEMDIDHWIQRINSQSVDERIHTLSYVDLDRDLYEMVGYRSNIDPQIDIESEFQKIVGTDKKYLYVTTIQNDNFTFYEDTAEFDIYAKRDKLNAIFNSVE